PDDLQEAVLLDAFGLDGDDAFTVLLGDRDLTQLVLGLYTELFLGAQVGGFGLQPLLGLDMGGLGLFPGADDLDLTLGLGGRLLATLLQLGECFGGLGVLAVDLLLAVVLELVGALVLLGGALRDLRYALGVEDVVGVVLVQRGLFQLVDGHVLEDVAVEVGAGHRRDRLTERLSLGGRLLEVELFGAGLVRLGDLGA